MAMYAYIKAKRKIGRRRVPRKVAGLLSVASVLCGLFFIGAVTYPIVGWYLFVLPAYRAGIVSPLASYFKIEQSPVFPTVVSAAGVVDPATNNSYKPSTWFNGASTFSDVTTGLKSYTISIPKLKIDAATVEVGGDDLKKSLIAWPTSALPGAYGNNIIFGHSELPQFASPSDYSGIFTHLLDLNKGDPILVDFDGVRYKYEVVEKKIISATDLSVLEQRFDSAYITLITCEPPGTTWMRGVIRGRLVQF